MTEQYLPQGTVEEIMNNVGHRIFTVKFRKSNGALRKINARLGVTAHLAGGRKTTDDATHQTAWNNADGHYFCFPKTKVLSIKALGQTYVGIRPSAFPTDNSSKAPEIRPDNYAS